MKTFLKIIFVGFSVLFLFYLLLPNPPFPNPPSDSSQSKEPADTETIFRRAYFTNFTREEVMNSYKLQFEHSAFLNLPLPTYRLNYPPEDAQTIIRDQTRSTFLEEVVHPFRESVFINGFEPKEAKDAIEINGTPWRQKITVRYIPSNVFVRVGLALATLVLILFLSKEWYFTFRDVKNLKIWK